ncbi:MAG: hypothetical protein EA397_02050 [Deltaproteobacteria bacterium]|nr:MAG: hypothetical protein EA397_02050 [Deltaproteobacteria bacterium]
MSKPWRFLLPLAFVAGVVGLAGAFSWGFAAERYQVFPRAQIEQARQLWHQAQRPAAPDVEGRWRLRDGRRPWLLEDPQAYTWEQLQALGYAEGTQSPEGDVGVLVLERSATPGLSLVTSGHAPEALLLDLRGEVVHRWSADAQTIFPEVVAQGRPARPYYRRAILLPDGSILAMIVDLGFFRLGLDGEVLWRWEGEAHHDFSVDGQGGVWVLAREVTTARPPLPPGPMIEDLAVRLDLDTGEELQRFSLFDALADSPHRNQLHGLAQAKEGDYFHTNSLKVLDGAHADRLPAFSQGRLLLSMRHLNLVLVVDPDTTSTVWAWRGPWRYQHEPLVVPPGHLLVFDNLSMWPRSRAVEVDPASQRVVWSFDGGTRPLVSETCGTVQRLPNGHTIAVASDTGRAVEVDPEGRIVWDWVSPYRAGPDQDLIATLFQAQRLTGPELGPFADRAESPQISEPSDRPAKGAPP